MHLGSCRRTRETAILHVFPLLKKKPRMPSRGHIVLEIFLVLLQWMVGVDKIFCFLIPSAKTIQLSTCHFNFDNALDVRGFWKKLKCCLENVKNIQYYQAVYTMLNLCKNAYRRQMHISKFYYPYFSQAASFFQ